MNKTHDKLIISILLKSNGAIRQKYLDNKDKYINLTNYLDNRYEDSDSLRETVARMRFNVEHKPLCPACGKKVTFKKVSHNSYIIWNTYCSMECSKSKNAHKIQKERYIKTCLEKYGVENPYQSEQVKDKIKQTCLKRYGVEHPMKLDFYKSKVNAAIYESKKKNHTFNTSKPEENGYKLLYNKFGFCNVKRQYRTELYQFACDFYIKSLDLYIEFNFYWTHGKHKRSLRSAHAVHKFDSNNKDDVDKLNDLKIKYNNGEHPLYKGAIITWTKSDPKKFNTAKKNNLNYLAFYNWNEFLEWYKLI